MPRRATLRRFFAITRLLLFMPRDDAAATLRLRYLPCFDVDAIAADFDVDIIV